MASISLNIIIRRKLIKVELWKFASNDRLNFLKDFLAYLWSSSRNWKRFLPEKKIVITAVINIIIIVISIINMKWNSFRTWSHCSFNAAPLRLFVLVARIHYSVYSLVWEKKMVVSSEIQIQIAISIFSILFSDTISSNSHWITWVS